MTAVQGGKSGLVHRYGNVDKELRFRSAARVFIVDCAPICATQACIEVFQVAAIGNVVSETDIRYDSLFTAMYVSV